MGFYSGKHIACEAGNRKGSKGDEGEMKKIKVKFTLGIGYANAKHEDEQELELERMGLELY
jgi:hypothetical protein